MPNRIIRPGDQIVADDSAAQALIGNLEGNRNVLFCGDSIEGLSETLIAELSRALENSGQTIPTRLDHEGDSVYANRLAEALGTGVDWLIS